jgi:uncharacterized membrane protein (UPF0127 family)
MIRFLKVVLVLLMLGLSGGTCDENVTTPTTKPAGPQPQSLPTITLTLGGRPFRIQVADSEGEHQIGLMYRDSMPADHGMIFIFPDERLREFWMKNTRIPLDIIYLDRRGQIVSIKQMKPYDLTGVPSDRPARFAIELNQGIARQINLKVGDRIEIPAHLTEPTR